MSGLSMGRRLKEKIQLNTLSPQEPGVPFNHVEVMTVEVFQHENIPGGKENRE